MDGSQQLSFSMTRYLPHDMAQNSVIQQPTFASLDALSPCMIKHWISSIPTGLEPSTAASTAAVLAVPISIRAL